MDRWGKARIKPGDVIVGGRNFGCGSSRETSIQSLKLNRIAAIVAQDFARIFFRNATNNGLPCLTFENPADQHLISAGETVQIHLDEALLITSAQQRIRLTPPGDFVQRIWDANGLLGLLPHASPAPQAGGAHAARPVAGNGR